MVKDKVEEHTHTQPFYGSVEFVRDNPGEPVPEETLTQVEEAELKTLK